MHTCNSAFCIFFLVEADWVIVVLKEKLDMQGRKQNDAAKATRSRRTSGEERKIALQQDV